MTFEILNVIWRLTMEGTMLLNDLIKLLKRYFWIILLCLFIGGIIGKVLVPEGLAPTYKASALILIQKKEADTGIIINQTDEMGRFFNTAQTLIKTSAILDNVKKELKLQESTKELADMIEVTNENNSQIIKIASEQTDPQKVTNIVNSTAQNFTKEAGQYLDINTVTIVEKAENGEETKILHTRSKANIAMGAILGLVFGTIIAFVLTMMSNRKKHVE